VRVRKNKEKKEQKNVNWNCHFSTPEARTKKYKEKKLGRKGT
jgi:hypothetical protein